VIDMGDMVCRWLDRKTRKHGSRVGVDIFVRTGDGRWSRVAAIRSPGDSNATTGRPNVMPIKLASAPPREWPITQMFDSGLEIRYQCFMEELKH